LEAMINEVSNGRLDDEAFKKAVLQYRERIFLVILRFIKNREDAKDLTQDTFVKAYRSRAYFRGDSGIYTWLYKIAINLSLNYKSRSRISSFSSLEDEPEIAGHNDPSKGVLNSELGDNIGHAISKLPPRQRMVFILRYYDEMAHAQIGSLLGITEGAVKANYHQAIKKLRAELSQYLEVKV
jgi:RNA polymerase sigma factor (sigma-70 family)